MIVMTLTNVQKFFGSTHILKDINCTLKSGERLGIVGTNGCGKTTLLRIIAGELEKDEGSISLSKGLKLGYLAQQNKVEDGKTVYEVLYDVFEHTRTLEEKMRKLEEEMGQAQDEETLMRMGDTYAKLSHAFEKEKGYEYPSLIMGMLSGLGFPKQQHTQLANSLSGGEMTRLCLAKLLLLEPDVLLLDEPTNHLDLQALAWLESYLKDYKGSIVVVSHDRFFLDSICTSIAEILLGKLEQYNGNYTFYQMLRKERILTRERAFEAQQKEIAHQQAVIDKLRSFNREKSIKRAESREKMLDKIEILEKPKEERPISFRFEAARRTGDDVLRVKNFSKSFEERPLFQGLSLDLKRGDRVALLGKNGIGKTTFFKCLIGAATPDSGFVNWGSNVDMGYYDQHQSTLHSDKTILDEVWDAFPRMEQTAIRSALGLFQFTGEEVFQRIGVLSGGEKGRVALTKLMLKKDNLLLLDEPTNHLDMNSREVLEGAIASFEGTLLAISHDRYFVNRVANKVIEMTPDGLKVYEGNFDAYQLAKERENAPEDDFVTQGKTKTDILKEKRKIREGKDRLKALKQKVKETEEAVFLAETAVEEHEAFMASPEAYLNNEAIQQSASLYKEKKQALAEAYKAWEDAEEALEMALTEE